MPPSRGASARSPGWGHQLDPDVVLTQMREVGIAATEFGPDGFLPDAPEDKAATLAAHGLASVGQFVPVVLHDAQADPLPDRRDGDDGAGRREAPRRWSSPPPPARRATTTGRSSTTPSGRRSCATSTGSATPPRPAASPRRCTPTSGRWSRAVRRPTACSRAAGSGLCLDTGHLLIGGGDPVARRRRPPASGSPTSTSRTSASTSPARSRRGGTPTPGAVARGMYVPLGRGRRRHRGHRRTPSRERATPAGTSSSRTPS